MALIGCIEDYPVIETAIERGVERNNGKQGVVAIQFAAMWMEGYIYAMGDKLSDVDINILRNGVNNYIFL